MAFECPRRSSPPSPMFDADTGCIATDPAPSARRRFRSKTGIENLPANEHAQETPHTPSPTRTTRRIQSGCAGSRPRLRDGMPGSPSQHIDITRAKWIPYIWKTCGIGQGSTSRASISLATAGPAAPCSESGAPPRREIRAPGIHEPISHYTDAVQAGDFLFVSGQGPFDGDFKLPGDTMTAQATQMHDSIQRALSEQIGLSHLARSLSV